MNIRFIDKTINAYLDYTVAASLIGTPFLLGVGANNPLALWLSVATGVAALVLTVLTDHKTGLIRIIPFRMHLLVDRLVGVVFIAAPLALGFVGLDALYYYLAGAAVLLVTLALNSPQGDQGEAVSKTL